MLRALVLAIVVLMTAHTGAVQTLNVLHIKVVVVDGKGQAMPVPRLRLQISDNPASALPRRVITSLEGTIDVQLAPGNYTVESEKAVNFDGKSYQWAVVVDIVAGRDATLELTSQNAEVGAPSDSPDAAPPLEADPSSLLARWQDSVVAIWTATTHGSGFLIDSNGLIATDLQVIGSASSVEVQLSPTVKVAGSVIASDVARGIALVRINPSIASSSKAVPLECDQAPAILVKGQELTALEAPLARLRGTRVGFVESVLPNVLDTDLVSSASGSGGPAFAPDGRFAGLTTLVPDRDGGRSNRSRIVRVKPVCDFIASSEEKIKTAPLPSDAHLPVESLKPFPAGSTTVGGTGRAANPIYRMASDDFDIVFLTPVQVAAALAAGPTQLLTDFGNWTEYVEGAPAVLLIRVTPKSVESFWTKVGRGVAMTQGVSIPSIKRPKGDFGKMRALCGDAEVVPVHPFKLEHRMTDNDTLVEGLYAFDPGALTPSCATVTLELFSEKEPRKADSLIVDPKLLQQLWQDFAPLRPSRRPGL